VAAPRVALVAARPVVEMVRTRADALAPMDAHRVTVPNGALTAPVPRLVPVVPPATAPRAVTATPVPTVTDPVRRGSAVARLVTLVKMAVTRAPTPIALLDALIAMTPVTTVVVVPQPQHAVRPLAADRPSPTLAADVPRRVVVRPRAGAMSATPAVTVATPAT